MFKQVFYGFFALLFAISPLKLWAGQKVTVGAKVATGQQISMDQIDHSAFDALLQKYCDAQGFVDYRGWQQSQADMQQLDRYLAHLSQANPAAAASQNNKYAFWINAYNAVTIKGILQKYPVKSIKDLQSIGFGYKIWDDLLLTVGGRGYSLNQMEHEVLRPMGDPRVHFALVCASIGCPPLMNRAFTGDQVGQQMDFNAKRFFADPGKFAASSGELKLSKILSWYGGDFGSDQATQLRAIAPYLPTAEAQALARSGRARVGYLNYDWNLNDQASLR